MLRIFLKGVPFEHSFLDSDVTMLHQEIANVVGLDPGHVEVYVEDTRYKILTYAGATKAAGTIRVVVEWFGGSLNVKQLVARAIRKFLRFYELYSDVTFENHEPGDCFIDGEVVGSPPGIGSA